MPEMPTWEQTIATLTGPGGPFEIVEREIAGRPTKAFANTPPSLRDAFACARLHGDKTFLVY